jgi:transglutaminase-like putative cysteine protease
VQIRVGYELTYSLPQPTPMLLTVHNSLFPRGRSRGALSPSYLAFCADHGYRDLFGNWISRIVAPPGQIRLSGHATVNDAGNPDPTCPNAIQHAVQDLPEESLVFLLGSRYCRTDHLSEIAWNLFGRSPLGWATCASDLHFVHNHLRFGYEHARPTKTAWEVYRSAPECAATLHIWAITLCRCMNVPARYCTGYLGDIGVPATDAPMDFSGWFEAYLGGQWHVFDARFNTPWTGRVLMARGRDAADVAIATTFGPNTLTGFQVFAEET